MARLCARVGGHFDGKIGCLGGQVGGQVDGRVSGRIGKGSLAGYEVACQLWPGW